MQGELLAELVHSPRVAQVERDHLLGRETRRGRGRRAVEARAIEVGAIPYFAWANRSAGGMRVWIPVRS